MESERELGVALGGRGTEYENTNGVLGFVDGNGQWLGLARVLFWEIWSGEPRVGNMIVLSVEILTNHESRGMAEPANKEHDLEEEEKK